MCTNSEYFGITESKRRRKEERKNDACLEQFYWQEELYKAIQRNGDMDLSELQDIDSLYNEGTNTLLKGDLSWRDGFTGRGRTNDRH